MACLLHFNLQDKKKVRRLAPALYFESHEYFYCTAASKEAIFEYVKLLDGQIFCRLPPAWCFKVIVQ